MSGNYTIEARALEIGLWTHNFWAFYDPAGNLIGEMHAFPIDPATGLPNVVNIPFIGSQIFDFGGAPVRLFHFDATNKNPAFPGLPGLPDAGGFSGLLWFQSAA